MVDGDYGEPRPNRAMQLQGCIQEQITELEHELSRLANLKESKKDTDEDSTTNSTVVK